MGKSSIGINLMVITIQESAKVLFILCYFVAIAMILFSSMMYYAEMENSQAAFFASIPRTFWWCLVPVTPVGRIIAVITMFSGILILALPISVIGSNFAATYERLAFEMGAQKKVVDRKDKKGKIDPKKLVAFLKELEVQGSLIEGVTVPQDVDEAQAILDSYDTGNTGKLDNRQWQHLIKSMVVDPSEFTDTTVLKLARDLNTVRNEVEALKTQMNKQAAENAAATQHLIALLQSLGAQANAPTRVSASAEFGLSA